MTLMKGFMKTIEVQGDHIWLSLPPPNKLAGVFRERYNRTDSETEE